MSVAGYHIQGVDFLYSSGTRYSGKYQAQFRSLNRKGEKEKEGGEGEQGRKSGEGEHWIEVELGSKRGRGRAGDIGRAGDRVRVEERGRESRESPATRLARLVSVI